LGWEVAAHAAAEVQAVVIEQMLILIAGSLEEVAAAVLNPAGAVQFVEVEAEAGEACFHETLEAGQAAVREATVQVEEALVVVAVELLLAGATCRCPMEAAAVVAGVAVAVAVAAASRSGIDQPWH